MCIAIAHKGKDLIYGYNLDVDPNVWNYSIHKNKNYFSIGITVGKTTYFTHGVNKNGQFGNLPYMNNETYRIFKTCKSQRIDLLVDKYIRNKITYKDIKEIIKEKTIVDAKGLSMHSLIGNIDGKMLLIEPGLGANNIKENYAVVSNFPILTTLSDYSNPFYGKQRYDIASDILSKSNEEFSYEDALDLLNKCKQTGTWATRVSFVYSKNNNCVYYCLNGNFKNILIHKF